MQKEKKGGKMKGYCLKCKAKQEIKDAQKITMKNKNEAMKGKCPVCETTIFNILPKVKGEKKDV